MQRIILIALLLSLSCASAGVAVAQSRKTPSPAPAPVDPPAPGDPYFKASKSSKGDAARVSEEVDMTNELMTESSTHPTAVPLILMMDPVRGDVIKTGNLSGRRGLGKGCGNPIGRTPEELDMTNELMTESSTHPNAVPMFLLADPARGKIFESSILKGGCKP